MDYVLSCSSTVDYPASFLRERKIPFSKFHYFLDGVEHYDDCGESMPFPVFYQKMRDGAEVSTSQVGVGEYCDYFRKFLQEKKDILHVCLSSALSGDINSATTAADMLVKEFPERKIYVLDSLCASSGYGLFVETLADARDRGKTLEELKAFGEQIRLSLQHLFYSTELKWYVKGGRLSPGAALVGSLLGICPVMHMDNKGRLCPNGKVRTRKKAMFKLLEQMEDLADNGRDYKGRCCICHSDIAEEAKEFAKLIKEKFPHIKGDVGINNVGTVIGSHTGPGTMALFFFGKERQA